MANPDALISLSQLEAQLGISRVDLLLLMRRLGLEPIRKGLRTFLREVDAAVLIERTSAPPAESLTAELVVEEPSLPALPVRAEESWFKADLYADLRLFRERIDILERLVRTGIEVESQPLAELLALKRLPVVLDDRGHPYFDRHGLRFHRMRRRGQRLSWKVSRI